MATRRELRFDTLDDVVRDAEHLLAVGYERAGNWDLAQCCGHLAEWMRYPMDGFPKAPLLARPVFWLIRNTVGRRMGRAMFSGGRMKEGIPTAPQSVPAAGGDEAAAVARLRETVARWYTHAGPLYPSPLFGALTRDQWLTGQLVHCAHHLSFLVPRQG